MYRRENRHQLSFEDRFLPFGGKLSGDNRSIKLAELIPWDELDDDYAAQFCKGFAAPAKPFRMALGALIIKACLGLTDEELVEQVKESPYLQLFIGLKVIRSSDSQGQGDDNGSGGGLTNPAVRSKPSSQKQPNQGSLLIAATCAPVDIFHPTDLSLLNEAREVTEILIDAMLLRLDKALAISLVPTANRPGSSFFAVALAEGLYEAVEEKKPYQLDPQGHQVAAWPPQAKSLEHRRPGRLWWLPSDRPRAYLSEVAGDQRAGPPSDHSPSRRQQKHPRSHHQPLPGPYQTDGPRESSLQC